MPWYEKFLLQSRAGLSIGVLNIPLVLAEKGSPWHWRAGPTRPFRASRETGAEKEKKQMIEQIKQTNRGQFIVESSLQVRTA
jgi:hypothetical protein